MSLFDFTPVDSYSFPEDNDDTILVTYDPSAGQLLVTLPGASPVAYPLMDEDDEPLPRAIYVDPNASADQFQIGSVTYLREGLIVDQYPVNLQSDEITFTVSKMGGHIGILDIRDTFRHKKVDYFFDMMPVVLSIAGAHLVVKTLRHEDEDAFGPWYLISQIP